MACGPRPLRFTLLMCCWDADRTQVFVVHITNGHVEQQRGAQLMWLTPGPRLQTMAGVTGVPGQINIYVRCIDDQ